MIKIIPLHIFFHSFLSRSLSSHLTLKLMSLGPTPSQPLISLKPTPSQPPISLNSLSQLRSLNSHRSSTHQLSQLLIASNPHYLAAYLSQIDAVPAAYLSQFILSTLVSQLPPKLDPPAVPSAHLSQTDAIPAAISLNSLSQLPLKLDPPAVPAVDRLRPTPSQPIHIRSVVSIIL